MTNVYWSCTQLTASRCSVCMACMQSSSSFSSCCWYLFSSVAFVVVVARNTNCSESNPNPRFWIHFPHSCTLTHSLCQNLCLCTIFRQITFYQLSSSMLACLSCSVKQLSKVHAAGRLCKFSKFWTHTRCIYENMYARPWTQHFSPLFQASLA